MRQDILDGATTLLNPLEAGRELDGADSERSLFDMAMDRDSFHFMELSASVESDISLEFIAADLRTSNLFVLTATTCVVPIGIGAILFEMEPAPPPHVP